jgi:hypothetical protein
VRNWGREQEILQSHPPDELKLVSDIVVNETMEERMKRFERGGYGFTSEMPVEMREEIFREMRANASSARQWAEQSRHEIYSVAFWRSESLLRKK